MKFSYSWLCDHLETDKNANEIEKRGFFIGLHTKKIKNITLKYLCESLLKIEKN